MMIGLASLVLSFTALAAENDQQVVSGNPVATMSITAPTDNTAIAFTVGGQNADEGADAPDAGKVNGPVVKSLRACVRQ